MAQSGFTPIQIYSSSTASATPLAANLTNNTFGAELAINITDGKLFYKDNSGTVQVLASKASVTNVNTLSFGTTGLTPSTATSGAITVAGTLITTNGGTGLSSYTAGDLLYYSSGTTLSKLAIGTNGQYLSVSGGVLAWASAPSVSLTVGSTSVSGGTSGYILYNNAGTLGNLATTGSGSVVLATSPTLVTPLLGTPTSGTLTNCTGLPISTGVSGLAAGAATFLTTPTSANLAALLTDETGTGANVFATSPTLVTPLLGTPTSGVLTNCTGLPLTTGITGILGVANGGTGLAIPPANGALDIGNGTNFTRTTLTAGTGVGITNGAGSITINATGATINSQTAAYILAAADAGKIVSITTGGVTVNNSIMSAGNIVTIYNNSASSQTITQGTGVTLQWAGQATSTTGNRTLALFGVATIFFLSASSAVISGAGLT